MTTAGIVLAALCGAVGMLLCVVLGYFLIKAVRSCWKLASDLASGIKTMSALMERVIPSAEGIHQELAYMRSITQQQTQSPDVLQGPVPLGVKARQYVAFPPTDYSRFPVVSDAGKPDAEKDDTDLELLEQTDEQLRQMEIIESLRQRGMEVEDSDTEHPGIETEA